VQSQHLTAILMAKALQEARANAGVIKGVRYQRALRPGEERNHLGQKSAQSKADLLDIRASRLRPSTWDGSQYRTEDTSISREGDVTNAPAIRIKSQALLRLLGH
jgi:hypothetical protein